jgi:hypothetical protein
MKYIFFLIEVVVKVENIEEAVVIIVGKGCRCLRVRKSTRWISSPMSPTQAVLASRAYLFHDSSGCTSTAELSTGGSRAISTGV